MKNLNKDSPLGFIVYYFIIFFVLVTIFTLGSSLLYEFLYKILDIKVYIRGFLLQPNLLNLIDHL